MTRAIDDERLDDLVDLVVQPAPGNLGARLAASDARDPLDAVITGVDLFAEELDRVHRLVEREPRESAPVRDGVAAGRSG